MFVSSSVITFVTFVEVVSKVCVKVSQVGIIMATTSQKAIVFRPYLPPIFSNVLLTVSREQGIH